MKANIFYCIGAQKAGTSWLYNNLKKHPSVSLPPFKELHFFDYLELKKGNILNGFFKKDYGNLAHKRRFLKALENILKFQGKSDDYWIFRYAITRRSKNGIPGYKKLLLSLGAKDSVFGEVTPAYSTLNKDTVRLIYENFPELKVIFILRDPVEREWSAAKMELLKKKIRTNQTLMKPNSRSSFKEII